MKVILIEKILFKLMNCILVDIWTNKQIDRLKVSTNAWNAAKRSWGSAGGLRSGLKPGEEEDRGYTNVSCYLGHRNQNKFRASVCPSAIKSILHPSVDKIMGFQQCVYVILILFSVVYVTIIFHTNLYVKHSNRIILNEYI